MSIEIQVVPLRDILRTNVVGEYDFEGARRVTQQIAEASRARPTMHILLDAREAATPTLAPVDLFNLAKLMQGLGVGVRNRLAILYRPRDEIDRGQLFALCAAEQGMHVGAFQEFEAALDWLSLGCS